VDTNNNVDSREQVSLKLNENDGQSVTQVTEAPNFTALYARLINFGIAYSDLERIRRTSTDWTSFSRTLGDLAEFYLDQAEKEWESGRLETPRVQWKRAADYYHYSQLKLPDSLLKASFRRASGECYAKAASLLDPPAIRFEIPFRSIDLVGYLRVKRPGAPCVILIGGLDSSKEVELDYFAETFLRRGCSVVFFDGPGQGELYGRGSMAWGFEHVISAVIDFLRKDSRVGPTALGCFGVALGGHLACRAAACNPEIDACISIGGFFDARVLCRLPPLAQALCLKAFGFASDSDISEVAPHIDLAPLAGQMQAPLLLIHGTADHLVDMEQITAFQNWACGPINTLVLEGSEHVCCDRFNECLPIMGDWMVDRLLYKKPQPASLSPMNNYLCGQTTQGEERRKAVPKQNSLTLINMFIVKPHKQQALVDLLSKVGEKAICHMPGFLSARIYRGIDGTHVANCVEWRSREDFHRMLQHPETQQHIEEIHAITRGNPQLFELCTVLEPTTERVPQETN
jgi:2,6-dihydroxypseudooxynicotine hydrolase